MLIGDVSMLYLYNNSYMSNRLTPPPTADPPSSRDFTTDYLERVKKTHETEDTAPSGEDWRGGA